jgi:hypothetical protein
MVKPPKAAKGSDKLEAVAHDTPIGAMICIISAIKKAGR